MKRNKLISFLFVIGILGFSVNAQVFDEDLFGSADDDFFDDDGIVELEVNENESVANADLKKGILFQDGSVKTGGSFTTSVTTNTLLYSEDEKSFGDYLSETVLTPEVSAYLTIDARPNQNLRMYSKFGLAYPFQSTAASSSECLSMKVGEIFPESDPRWYRRDGKKDFTGDAAGTALIRANNLDSFGKSRISGEGDAGFCICGGIASGNGEVVR